MEQASKDKLLSEAQSFIADVSSNAKRQLPDAENAVKRAEDGILNARSAEDMMLKKNLLQVFSRIKEGLLNASDSPFFSRCDTVTESNESKTLYFGKYSLHDLGIYSWVSQF